MEATPSKCSQRTSGKQSSRLARALSATAVLLLWTGAGCGPSQEESSPLEPGTTAQELATLNGLAFNGLAFNGLAFNGLAFNGLAFNGLPHEAFTAWFDSDPAMANMLMKYVVACAVPAGQSRTYTHGGTDYTWQGWLGLAPDWASGSPATEAEQQIVSACLAAHGNKYGQRVLISILGRDARGVPIPTFSWEQDSFPEREACFFGNLFTGDGLYVGNDRGRLNERESTARACALSSSTEAAREACPPLVYVGSCQGSCTKDPTNTWYVSCQVNGITYQPLTTRMRDEDIYRCGDGVCQFTESCGTGRTYDNCRLDCGRCG
ncbi:hypothetical protein ATI61_103533 [Archangium gephyra]|uniref:Alpha-1,2-mannosidase n=1 Tax=Archangium gephyra TaxID=48 RepID=A0AAC8Q658_9BACT|nr:hypothetical protein [Archangium gephyra]AKJ01818.1 Alpha-1,2-mannosidase [Archangium gephyra]REG34627.1 hypothetical protein ATI61_103533 [Archangium gephyra]